MTALAGSASAFYVMNTRPFVVAAHGVDVSVVARSTAAIAPPARSPQPAAVRARRAELAPSHRTEPRSAGALVAVLPELGQRLRAQAVRLRPEDVFPPTSRSRPANIVRWTTGSVMIGDVELGARSRRSGRRSRSSPRSRRWRSSRPATRRRTCGSGSAGRSTSKPDWPPSPDHRVEPRRRACRSSPRCRCPGCRPAAAAVERADREALELERAEARVHALQRVGIARQQLLAAAQVGSGEPARSQSRRPVDELAGGPDHAAVAGLEELVTGCAGS